MRAQRAADEPVLLVSGHAWPVWDYYAADMPAVRLPDLDVLDVDATLGYETGAALEAALTGAGGAWLVQWQDEVVDPIGVAPYFLGRAGRELGARGRLPATGGASLAAGSRRDLPHGTRATAR